MVVIVAIEMCLAMEIFRIVERVSYALEPDVETSNQRFLYLHIDRLVTFGFQDVIFGYIWLFYRVPEDIYMLYSELCKHGFYAIKLYRAILLFNFSETRQEHIIT